MGPSAPDAYAWLRQHLTIGRFRELLTEAAGLRCRPLRAAEPPGPQLRRARPLAPGVSATTRPDPQAKGLGEYLRSRLVTVADRRSGGSGPFGQINEH